MEKTIEYAYFNYVCSTTPLTIITHIQQIINLKLLRRIQCYKIGTLLEMGSYSSTTMCQYMETITQFSEQYTDYFTNMSQ